MDKKTIHQIQASRHCHACYLTRNSQCACILQPHVDWLINSHYSHYRGGSALKPHPCRRSLRTSPPYLCDMEIRQDSYFFKSNGFLFSVPQCLFMYCPRLTEIAFFTVIFFIMTGRGRNSQSRADRVAQPRCR